MKKLFLFIAVVFGCVMCMPAQNYVGGHECVDLGLPSGVKWATCNVGAYKASDAGYYLCWSETRTKDEYTYQSFKVVKDLKDLSGNSRYDAATANWGAPWRTPSQKEFCELVKECQWKWITRDGQHGALITGPNGNSIFLPAAGQTYGTSVRYLERGCYWASESYMSSDAHSLEIYQSYRAGYVNPMVNKMNQMFGNCVRPVCD